LEIRNPTDFASPLGPLGGACNAGNLKEIRARMKSVKSIEKITKTMKMIASSRLKAAQNRMEKARPFYEGASKILSVFPVDTSKRNLLIPVTADRGLCGAINSIIAKTTRLTLAQRSQAHPESTFRLVSMGDKGNNLFGRDQSQRMAFSIGDMGRRPFGFASVSLITDKIMQEETFDSVSVIHNKFLSVISYTQVVKDIPSPGQLLSRPELADYEFEEDQRLFHVQDLFEFELGAALYSAHTESVAAELGARMNAMDSASRNAADMLKSLNVTYNRKRQAAITTELTEIISGASAVE
jgi:F-type H+-transporting ATPase subunit gamma